VCFPRTQLEANQQQINYEDTSAYRDFTMCAGRALP
jgi:hypothetical protein